MTEDLLSADQRYCCHAYLTFVALPQPPLSTLLPPTLPTAEQQRQRYDEATAARAAMANSPAARRYSFSLPGAGKSSGTKGQRSIQLPAIEPVTSIEMERYTMAHSRREKRLQQSNEAREEENQLLSDIRDQMRRWNVASTTISRRTSRDSDPSSPFATTAGGHPKRIAMQATFAESAQLVLPQHANSLSITFGGQVMKWMENVAAVSASRFARVPIVTAR